MSSIFNARAKTRRRAQLVYYYSTEINLVIALSFFGPQTSLLYQMKEDIFLSQAVWISQKWENRLMYHFMRTGHNCLFKIVKAYLPSAEKKAIRNAFYC